MHVLPIIEMMGPGLVINDVVNDINYDKLGLSWAKLSYQLGFAFTLTIICCIILINKLCLV